MLKQTCFYALSLSFICCLEAANPSAQRSSSTEEKYDIMRRDQIDNTDTLAIPLDDSEVEDEAQINLEEHKELFPLPHSPAKPVKK